MVTWVAWVNFLRELRGNVSPWVAWVNFLRELRGLRGSRYFLRGSMFYVGHNFYVGCVGQIYFCVGLCVGQLLFTRRDYFQMSTRLCLTSSLFLSSLGSLQRFRWSSF